MGQWFIGKIPLDMKGDNIKYEFLQKQPSNIPPFHHSMCEAKTPSLKN
jgi:hypothetical protein